MPANAVAGARLLSDEQQEWGIPKDSPAGRWRRAFAQRMERRRREGAEEEIKRVERGWCLGDEEFRRELLEQVSTWPGLSHFGEAVQEAAGARAERLVVEGLKRLGRTEDVLQARRKGMRGSWSWRGNCGGTRRCRWHGLLSACRWGAAAIWPGYWAGRKPGQPRADKPRSRYDNLIN